MGVVWDGLSGMLPQAEYTTVAVLVLAAIGMRLARGERQGVFTAVALFALSLVGVFLSLMVERGGGGTAVSFLRWFSILCEGLCVIYLLSVVVFRALLPIVRLELPRILQDIVAGMAYLMWGMIWLRANQVDLTGIIATSAVITAVIGFSLQDTLGNILGGVAMQLDQSIKVGDWIKVDDVVGRVVEIRWRRTSVETRNWETVVIPNSMLVKNKFVVLGRREGEPLQLRRWVWFNVDFRYPPTQVIDTVTQALCEAEIPCVARQPPPQCVLMDFADSYGRYAARYFLTDLLRDDSTDSQVRAHLYFALRRVNIPLSMPAHAVFVTKETTKRQATKAARELEERVHTLQRLELFAHLQEEELQHLAERLVPSPFAEGDVMTRQGATAHWLYIMVDGTADVVVENGHGQVSRVTELGPGSVFGEMGLMTGQPRTATVIARSAVNCYRLDRASFQHIIRARPSLAEEISNLLAVRRTQLEAALGHLDSEARSHQLNTARRDILESIRRFFGVEG